MLSICSRCASRMLRLSSVSTSRRALSRDTSEEVPTSFNADLEENKTSVTIVNQDKSMIFFGRFGRYGFKLSSGIFVLGPVLAFPKSVFSWQVSGPDEVSSASLSALRVLYPRPDIFLLGKGDPAVKLVNSDSLVAWFRELRISWEILPTEEALTTFNFLNSEGRHVAGAFLPPSMRDMYAEELAALDADKRRRTHFKLLESTAGTYSSELTDTPPDALKPLTFAQRGGKVVGSFRPQHSSGEASAHADTSKRVRLAQERALSEKRRQLSAKEARQRVQGEEAEADGDGETVGDADKKPDQSK